jgi:tetratricopeptide (TPR) repeat protein
LQESEAFTIYNKGLSLQRQGDTKAAEDVLRSLLESNLIRDATKHEEESEGNVLQPGLLLKYSAYKNLASIAAQRGDHNDAMVSYLEAVNVDSSDVTLWHKIGTTAIKLDNYQLAKFAFMQVKLCLGPKDGNFCFVTYLVRYQKTEISVFISNFLLCQHQCATALLQWDSQIDHKQTDPHVMVSASR